MQPDRLTAIRADGPPGPLATEADYLGVQVASREGVKEKDYAFEFFLFTLASRDELKEYPDGRLVRP